MGTITKLSKIQKKILRFLYELDKECIGTSELAIRVFDINLPLGFRSVSHWWGNTRNEEDRKAYNSVHASLFRSIARLKERGLVEAGATQHEWAICLVLTEDGRLVAEHLEPLPITEKWKA